MRVDSWEINSQYPNGHFVRSLGRIGDLKAEAMVLLVEHGINISSSAAVVKFFLFFLAGRGLGIVSVSMNMYLPFSYNLDARIAYQYTRKSLDNGSI